MGREIRKVCEKWNHPKKSNGAYIPLLGNSFKERLANWNVIKEKWDAGFIQGHSEFGESEWMPKEQHHLDMPFEEWHGGIPVKEDYMPEWEDSELTHIQLYESTSEGTPLSPLFKAHELDKLCEYAANNCTVFAEFKATKEKWMEMLGNGFVSHSVGNITFC